MKNKKIIFMGSPYISAQYLSALIKNNIANQLGINLDQIKIMQSYEDRKSPNNQESKLVWENHPSRIEKNNLVICDFCRSPSPKGEILRWGKCTFCWRKNI